MQDVERNFYKSSQISLTFLELAITEHCIW